EAHPVAVVQPVSLGDAAAVDERPVEAVEVLDDPPARGALEPGVGARDLDVPRERDVRPLRAADLVPALLQEVEDALLPGLVPPDQERLATALGGDDRRQVTRPLSRDARSLLC